MRLISHDLFFNIQISPSKNMLNLSTLIRAHRTSSQCHSPRAPSLSRLRGPLPIGSGWAPDFVT